jgi:hypothetical protein
MLITENNLRRLIKRELLKEVSDEKFKELETYNKKYNDDYIQKGVKHDIIKKSVIDPETQKYFDYAFLGIDKPLESYKERIAYSNDRIPEDIWDIDKMNARYHKKWWWDNHDQELFNNAEDLMNGTEKIVAIHELSAYAPQNAKSLDEFCNLYERMYKDISNKKQKNELSALGYINLNGLNSHEICKNLVGKIVSFGRLNSFFYLNPRTITYASKLDVCTERFSDYRPKYLDQTKASGTRKYPLHFKRSIESTLKQREMMDDYTVLDQGDFPTNNSKVLHEIIVGNWQIGSMWINMDFNELYRSLAEERQLNPDVTVKEYIEKVGFRHNMLLYFFASKGIPCFDANGQKLNREIYIRIYHNL